MLFHPGESCTENTPVNISTGKAFTQQSTKCVRSAQHTKEPKQLIRNMASFHPNRLKPIVY